MADSRRPRMLIISFSRIATDARVLRQVNEFSNDFEVTTCGEGGHPHDDVDHIRLVGERTSLRRHLTGILLNLRMFSLAYALDVRVAESRKKLRGMEFDVVIANDLTAVGVAHRLVSADKIHADLHEYWPGIMDQSVQWRKLWVPYLNALLRKHVVPARSTTTVSRVIAQRYHEEFGFTPEVVTNAGFYQSLEPVQVKSPIRLVHSGGVNPGRRLDLIMRGVAASRANVTLDMYLVGEGSSEHSKLVSLAEELGDRIRILPPVAHEDLVPTLNTYDIGIHVLAPTCTNNRLALPNKFFDFVQARLGMIIGPTDAMVELLEEHGLGLVTDDFEHESITRAIDELSQERVREFKENADTAAEALSASHQVSVWRRLIYEIVQPRKTAG